MEVRGGDEGDKEEGGRAEKAPQMETWMIYHEANCS